MLTKNNIDQTLNKPHPFHQLYHSFFLQPFLFPKKTYENINYIRRKQWVMIFLCKTNMFQVKDSTCNVVSFNPFYTSNIKRKTTPFITQLHNFPMLFLLPHPSPSNIISLIHFSISQPFFSLSKIDSFICSNIYFTSFFWVNFFTP